MIFEYAIQDIIKSNYPNYFITTNRSYAIDKENIVYIHKYDDEIRDYGMSEDVYVIINVLSKSYKEGETMIYNIYNLFKDEKYDATIADNYSNNFDIAKIKVKNKPIFVDIVENKFLFNFNLYALIVNKNHFFSIGG